MQISVIINTIDRAQPLLRTLESLEQQDYQNFEVIIVVGPTNDETLELLSTHYKDRIQLLRCPEDNLSQSRNIGLQAAQGEIVAFLDDDALPSRRWLSIIAKLFRHDPDLAAVGGTVYLCLEGEERIQHRYGLVSSLAEHVDVNSHPPIQPKGQGLFWTVRPMGTNMAFRKSVLVELGGFDEFIRYVAEESELALRMAWHGYKIKHYDPLIVYHLPASSRNRIVKTKKGRWYHATRSLVYFALKNGKMVGEPASRIWLRCLHLLNGHLKWYRQLYRTRQWSLIDFAKGYKDEVFAFIEATAAGLFQPRKLLTKPEESFKTQSPMILFKSKSTNSQRRLRIAIAYSGYRPPGKDGIGRLVHAYMEGLSSRGHDVHVIARSDDVEKVSLLENGKIHWITYELTRYPSFSNLPKSHHILNYSHAVYTKVKQLVESEGIELLITPLWLTEGLVTAVSGIVPVITVVETSAKKLGLIHKQKSQDESIIEEMEQLLLERANSILCISKAAKQMAQELYTLGDEKIEVIYPGISLPEVLEQPTNNSVSRPPTILYVGRLERRKGILELLQAIPKVLALVPEAKFVIVGHDNSQNDGFHASTGLTYEEFFSKNYPHLAKQVQFLGHVEEAKLDQLYRQCDIFVAPSLFESFGFVFIEAMSRGKPVISCAAGAIPEVIENGISGMLVEPGKSEALAEAIVELLLDTTKRTRMGEAAREHALTRFTLPRMAQELEAYLLRLVQG
ncbi:MAG: glycosyltransferase [Candidatus Caldarchaeum sp.]